MSLCKVVVVEGCAGLRDMVDLYDLGDMVCRKLEDAGIPVKYEVEQGRRVFAGVTAGKLTCRDRGNNDREFTWEP